MGDNLTKGIGGLLKSTNKLGEKKKISSNEEKSISDNFIDISLIDVNQEQPREFFDEEKMKELEKSIEENGLIEPIVLKEIGDRYEIIAGERRFRAHKNLGKEKIFAVVREITEGEENSVLALVENVQRQDLNPIEIAHALHRLREDYMLTQENIADKIGYSRGAVSNYLRIVNLTETVKELIKQNKISFGHAKVLLKITDEDDQADLAYKVVEENLSVRALEGLIKKISEINEDPVLSDEENSSQDSITKAQIIQKQLSSSFNLDFKLKEKKDGSGVLSLHFKDDEELEEILNTLNK